MKTCLKYILLIMVILLPICSYSQTDTIKIIIKKDSIQQIQIDSLQDEIEYIKVNCVNYYNSIMSSYRTQAIGAGIILAGYLYRDIDPNVLKLTGIYGGSIIIIGFIQRIIANKHFRKMAFEYNYYYYDNESFNTVGIRILF